MGATPGLEEAVHESGGEPRAATLRLGGRKFHIRTFRAKDLSATDFGEYVRAQAKTIASARIPGSSGNLYIRTRLQENGDANSSGNLYVRTRLQGNRDAESRSLRCLSTVTLRLLPHVSPGKRRRSILRCDFSNVNNPSRVCLQGNGDAAYASERASKKTQ
ncbi:hypothetical protein NDU88_000881 [Pleurodeles waltl]|uniref:Uncharacterized protein n=1 Tax=Pleurodeles waltl TaxID=8319 RepID=A0AAV7P520_PLEWA|nr:hypothetical protein NDU88_000881 [Pleurodeles waltl]